MIASVTEPSDLGFATSEVRVPKAAELVAGKIRRQIVSGELAEGSSLPPEATLVTRYGVSRPTLREAFRILESEQLVVVRRGARGGAIVRTPRVEVASRSAQALLQYRGATLEDIHEARILLEPQAAALLAERRNPDAVARLVEIHDRELAAVNNPEDIRREGARFHQTVVELAGNRTLILFSAMLTEIIEAHTARLQKLQAGGKVKRSRMRQAGHADHERLIDLVRAGATREAEQCWRQHLERVSQMLLSEVDAHTLLELVED
jgi:DNA-binding FadR family transcriptional regulator